MKKAFALLLAFLSGGYLLTLGIAPDPLPVVDEATALLILAKSLSVLGFDISRFIPFLRKGSPRKRRDSSGTIDV